jgi:hypothetical protein
MIKKILTTATLVGTLAAASLPLVARADIIFDPPPIDNPLACMAQAVSVREGTLIEGYRTYSQAVLDAYIQHASDLGEAWTIPQAKARNAAIKAANLAFTAAKADAKAVWKQTQADARATFLASKLDCQDND